MQSYLLDVKLKRNKEDGKIQTEWYQKKENAGIYCNIRSDVDEVTNRNLVKNLENKIGIRGFLLSFGIKHFKSHKSKLFVFYYMKATKNVL